MDKWCSYDSQQHPGTGIKCPHVPASVLFFPISKKGCDNSEVNSLTSLKIFLSPAMLEVVFEAGARINDE